MITLTVFALGAALIAGLLLYAHSRPDHAAVARSILIQAPPQKIFPFIEDLRLMGAWSPFEQLDPTVKRSFSGVARGTGAVYEWDGNGKLGAGRMEIIDSSPAARVIVELDFFRPIKADGIAEFSLRPVQGGTELRWEMDGRRPFLVKLIGLFLVLEEINGRAFEQGLASLKALVEEPRQPQGYWSGAGAGAVNASRLSASRAA
ncbi:MAG TPA: SRPBCC family protein [Gammaproteobacteria bacterium]|nr:SRPBCC family protein [Gammaproteobacteria bacterium]